MATLCQVRSVSMAETKGAIAPLAGSGCGKTVESSGTLDGMFPAADASGTDFIQDGRLFVKEAFRYRNVNRFPIAGLGLGLLQDSS